jgi:hypothetical protein
MPYKYTKYIKIIILILIWIALVVIVLSIKDIGSYKIPKFQYTVTSLPYDELTKLLPERVDFISKNSGIFDIVQKNKLSAIKNAYVSNASSNQNWRNILATMQLPNASYGFYPVEPLPDPNAISFRFNQGISGWHWAYQTYMDPETKTTSSVFSNLLHFDMIPPKMMKKYKLEQGTCSYYAICCGVSEKGVWHVSPYVIARGTYTGRSLGTFDFSLVETSDTRLHKFNWSSPNFGELVLDCEWLDGNDKIISVSATSISSRPPFFDAKNGCAPCVGGAGSLYMSFTHLNCDATISIDESSNSYTNGVGWLDHQLANATPSNFIYKIINNILPKPVGLPKYFWLILQLSDVTQYMIAVFPSYNGNVKVGDIFQKEVTVNKYGPTDIPQFACCDKSVEVMSIMLYEGVAYPTSYKIKINGDEYMLDSRPFGFPISPDPSSEFNVHFDGSALVYDKNNNVVGTGFCEANQLLDADSFNKNSWQSAGITDISAMQSKVPFVQILPSYILLFIIIISFILSIYVGYRVVELR